MKEVEEAWKTCAENDHYEVSNLGSIRRKLDAPGRHRTGWKLTPHYCKNGYARVHMYRNKKGSTYLVHKLVMSTFVGPCPNGYEVNHKDFDKANNRLTNLEYVTHQQNAIHKVAGGHANSLRGEEQPNSKLTWAQVKDARYKYFNTETTFRQLACECGVEVTTIRKAVLGKTWKGDYN
jgi:hypothetical protein